MSGGWIRSAERMPRVGEAVLVARRPENGGPLRVEQGILLPGGCWKTFGFKHKTIEWWRPLPPPPEE